MPSTQRDEHHSIYVTTPHRMEVIQRKLLRLSLSRVFDEIMTIYVRQNNNNECHISKATFLCMLSTNVYTTVCFIKPLSHQSGVLAAFPQRFKKLQNAEVRVVQTPATLCKRCGNAVQSPRTPCGCVYFGHAQNKRRGLAFAQRVRQNVVATLWQRCGVF